MTSILTPDKLTKEPNSKCAETLQTLKKKIRKIHKGLWPLRSSKTEMPHKKHELRGSALQRLAKHKL